MQNTLYGWIHEIAKSYHLRLSGHGWHGEGILLNPAVPQPAHIIMFMPSVECLKENSLRDSRCLHNH